LYARSEEMKEYAGLSAQPCSLPLLQLALTYLSAATVAASFSFLSTIFCIAFTSFDVSFGRRRKR
jgi:hypothetical protein